MPSLQSLRVTMILPSLRFGGAERVAVNLANQWVSWGLHVEFILMEDQGEFIDLLDSNIRIYNLACKRIRDVPTRIYSHLRSRPSHIFVVHMWPLTSVATLAWILAGCPGKMVLCEHIGLSDHIKRDLSTPLWLARHLLRFTHPRATNLVAVSGGAASDLAVLAGMKEDRVTVIYNPIVTEGIAQMSPHHASSEARIKLWGGYFRYYLLAVGELKAQKNHRLLLRAFARVAREIDACLVILGEGNLRPLLESDVNDLGLEGRVLLPGFQADPTPWYKVADLFVLSSDFEGFANVLVESLACGVPVLTTNCPHGPAEIVNFGRYGELVAPGDSEGFALGIKKALNRQWDREDLKNRALDFTVSKQAQAYLRLFSCE
jgi:glycosyltransferase involved in cell wall biosynthesis